MLVPNKMQHIICTGNVGSKEQYNELRQLAPNVHVVAGDCECAEDSSQFADSKVVQVGEFR
jgi:vacuolar protein sorting-associated protein 29